MIVTVTINPAIDKTVEVDSLARGGLNRIKRTVYDAGGKGINVSKTIKALGGESTATGFLGGNSGKKIADSLEGLGIDTDFVWTDGETRTNTKIVENNGILTELNEQGTFIPERRINELMQKLYSLASDNTLFVLSGSVPAGVDKNIYARITQMTHSRGASVLLDAEGELLRNALCEIPDIVKPNTAELEEYAGISGASEEELIAIVQGLIDKGIKTAALSMGEKGAVIFTEGKRAICPALDIEVRSPVGAGDAMAAALAYAFEKKLSHEYTIRLCMAVSAGAVTTAGTKPPSKTLVKGLINKVVIKYI